MDLEDDIGGLGGQQDNLFDDDDALNVGASGPNKDLFDESDEEAEPQRAPPLDLSDEEPEEQDRPTSQQPQAQPSAPTPAAPADIKAKLAALADKKRQEAEEGGKKRKKKDKDKGDKDKDGKKRKKDKDKDGKGSKRARRSERVPGEGKKERKAGGGPEASVDSREIDPEAADKDFIDDAETKNPEDEQLGSDVGGDEEDSGPGEPPPEAEEVDEAEDAEDMLFGRKRVKKNKETDQQMSLVVDDKIAKMEAAAETDMDEHAAGRPATSKLRMLSEVEEFLAQRKYHELFIHSGGLGVIKAWLEPYADGSLPNVRIRTAMMKACMALPIDTSREDIKESLKKSQLGSRIMFLAKCPDETPGNKKTAVELVQNWSRPIFFDPEAEAEKRRQREEALKKARMQLLQQSREREAAQAAELAAKNKIKHGEAGYRWHASIPQSSKLDYVVNPQPDEALAAAAATVQGTSKKDEGKFAKKMREVMRKQKGSTARAAVPSVEGRNIVLMH